MDLNQRKLNKSEWESIEVPVSDDEKIILTLICNGYHDVNMKYNKHLSLFGYLKVEYSLLMEDYLFYNYFLEKINQLNTYTDFVHDIKPNPKIKKADLIRIQRNNVEKIMNHLRKVYHSYTNKPNVSFKTFAKSVLGEKIYKQFVISAGYTDYENEDVFDVEVRIHDKIAAKKRFTGNVYPPKVRYSVNIKELIPQIISTIQEKLSQKKYSQTYAGIEL